jgi:hypothetical protein
LGRSQDFGPRYVFVFGPDEDIAPNPSNLALIDACREMQEERRALREQLAIQDKQNGRRRRSNGNELEVRFFSTNSAHVWN